MKHSMVVPLFVFACLIAGHDAYGWVESSRVGGYHRGSMHGASFRSRSRFAVHAPHQQARSPRPQTMPLFRRDWETVSSRADDPRDICTSVRSHVRYERDSGPQDEWRDGRSTWNRGAGDCEDFAMCVKELCEDRRIGAEVYRFYPPQGTGHAVVIGTWNGRMWMSSNGSYCEVASVEDAKNRVARSMGWSPRDTEVRIGAGRPRATSDGRSAAAW